MKFIIYHFESFCILHSTTIVLDIAEYCAPLSFPDVLAENQSEPYLHRRYDTAYGLYTEYPLFEPLNQS